jgi:hypothetical protein
MTLRKREDTGTRSRCGELAFEEAVGVSEDGLLNEWIKLLPDFYEIRYLNLVQNIVEQALFS